MPEESTKTLEETSEPDVPSEETNQDKKKKGRKPFPPNPFEESLEFAKEIETRSGSQPIRRLTLFDGIGKSPGSGPSRMLIINSNRYGLTEGGYAAESLVLTKEGHNATSNEVSKRVQAKAKIMLAIMEIDIFKQLYEQNIDQKLPASAVLIDNMVALGVEKKYAEEAVNLFIENLKFVGLLKTLSGAERIVSIDHALDEIPSTPKDNAITEITSPSYKESKDIKVEFESICFYITPIGGEESDERKHADLFYGTFIEPVVEKFNLKLIRADKIEKPGIINKQIIEYILKSKLVIADLSFNNLNVFYELAIRHTKGLPSVQIIRAQDKIPFDVNQLRTIKIDCSSIYKLVPQIELYKSQISNQVKKALEDPDSSDNPIISSYNTIGTAPPQKEDQ